MPAAGQNAKCFVILFENISACTAPHTQTHTQMDKQRKFMKLVPTTGALVKCVSRAFYFCSAFPHFPCRPFPISPALSVSCTLLCAHVALLQQLCNIFDASVCMLAVAEFSFLGFITICHSGLSGWHRRFVQSILLALSGHLYPKCGKKRLMSRKTQSSAMQRKNFSTPHTLLYKQAKLCIVAIRSTIELYPNKYSSFNCVAYHLFFSIA